MPCPVGPQSRRSACYPFSAEAGKGGPMARIKHIAIRTPDPEKTAAFYKDVFGLKEVGRARAGCYLSDGYINLAILTSKDEGTGERPRDEADYDGVHHFGFMVDGVDETCRPPRWPGSAADAPPRT